MKDPEVLALAAEPRRVLVSHDVGTLPTYFRAFKDVGKHGTGVFLIAQSLDIETAVESGPAGGTLAITSNAATQAVNLSGTGSATAHTVTVSPTSLLFPEQLLKTKSASQLITISNMGNSAVAMNGVSVTGDFAKSSTCTSSLAAGETCKVSITFTPTAAGTRMGTLTINLATGAQAAVLTGAGRMVPCRPC